MATSIVDKCKGFDIASNPFCISDFFSPGEGKDMILIPAATWNSYKALWETLTTETGKNVPVLAEVAGSPALEYYFNMPTATPSDVLFPDGENIVKDSLYFSGNPRIFNPTVVNAQEENGVSYQSSTLSIPIGSSREYDLLTRYIQNDAWMALKLNYNEQLIHVYGGIRGYFRTTDEGAEMLFSGNNDARGESSVGLTVTKAPYVIEYIRRGAETADNQALVKLFDIIKTAICKPSGVEELVPTPAPTPETPAV